jgi:uncharacterized membrane protein YdjX (TVP38/TMEM64 family)
MSKYGKWIVLALLLVAFSLATAFLPVKDWVQAFSDWVRTLGAVGAIVFIAVYAIATVLFLPGWIFTVAAGLVYGITGGTVVALSGAILGSTLAFLCGRYLVRRRVEAATKGNEKFEVIDRAIGAQGWKIVGLLRLSPIVPFNVSNYFYGITAVKFWPYVFASAIGMLPGTLLYTYLGAAGKAGLGAEGGQSPLKWVFLGVGLLATIVVTIIIGRTARNAFKKIDAGKETRSRS